MRALSLTSIVLLAALASCDSTPVEPPGVEADASIPLFKANQVWIEDSYYISNDVYVPCLGEDVRFAGDVPFRWHRVWNPASGYSDVTILRASTPDNPFLGVGLSSGIVWEARGSTDPAVYRAGPGETIHVNINEIYISDEGPNLRALGGFHATVNANGELTAFTPFSFETVCTGQG
jgi:hypothetical protein